MRRLPGFDSLMTYAGGQAIDQERIEALMAEEFTPARLRSLQVIYLALVLVLGVGTLFCIGTLLGLQSTGAEVDEVAGLIAYVGMIASVVLYFF